jgi:mannose-6-phosphate isomerase-like protein (cupin superfamily)
MIESGLLATTFVVSDAEFKTETVPVTESIWSDIDQRYGDFAGRTLVSSFEFAEAWPTWEMHPAGDELVCLIDGDVDLTLALPGGDEVLRLNEPGAFAVVPKGVWHTASPHRPTKMMFMTPGQGTENREEPLRE